MPREGRRSQGTASQETCFALSTFFLAGVSRVLRRVFTGVPYMFNARTTSLILIVLAAAATRLLPHPPNMTTITALALFGGATLADRRLAFGVPLLAMLLADLVLASISSASVISWQAHLVEQYLPLAAVVVLGFALRGRRAPLRVLTATLAGSLLFFALSNFGVWMAEGLYPKTGEGLVACYVAAIPFLANSLAGDLAYAALLFGGLALLERRFSVLREPQASAA